MDLQNWKEWIQGDQPEIVVEVQARDGGNSQ